MLEAQPEWWETNLQVTPAVAALINRVELSKAGIQLSLNLRALWPEGITDAAELSLTRFVALQTRWRGVETRLVIEGEASETGRTDPRAAQVGGAGASMVQ